MSEVIVSVRSQLSQVIKELERIKEQAGEVGSELKKTGRGVSDEIGKQTKDTENFLGRLRGLGGRVADGMRRDFRSLFSLNALQDSVKLSNQFRSAISETVTLSDQIRKLGGTFGIASTDFVKFQSTLTKGLGDIGLNSEVAAKALEGLAQTPVRGMDNITEYAKTAGQLASVGRQQGREGDIAQSLARVIQARGGNVNDTSQLAQLAESVRRVGLATGQGPSETLRYMEGIFANMAQDFRKTFSPTGLTNLAAAGAAAGPNATRFIEEYLSKSAIERLPFEMQGGKGIFTDQGLDIEKFRGFAQDITSRIGFDPEKAAQTLGLSEEAAKGFIRLAESLDKVKTAQDAIASTTGSLNEQYRQTMGLSEAFKASFNRIKSVLSEPLSTITQKGTDLLSKASESDLGAGLVTGGAGVLAALLAGQGLRGLGAGLAGTVVRKEAAEQMLGAQTIPVYVVNASEIGAGLGGVGLGAAAGGAMGMLGKAGLVGAAGIAGVGLGELIRPYLDKFLEEKTTKTNDQGFTGDIVDRLLFKLDMLIGGDATAAYRTPSGQPEQKVIIELNKRDLKESRQPTRGASN